MEQEGLADAERTAREVLRKDGRRVAEAGVHTLRDRWATMHLVGVTLDEWVRALEG